MLGVTLAEAAPFPRIHSQFKKKKKKRKIHLISFNPTRFPVWHKHSMVNMLTVKEKIPQITETRFVFLLLRQLYCTLHSTKLLKLDSDTVLLYILISYITA